MICNCNYYQFYELLYCLYNPRTILIDHALFSETDKTTSEKDVDKDKKSTKSKGIQRPRGHNGYVACNL